MRLRRRSPFAELVGVQLDLFLADNGGLLRDCDAALRDAYCAAFNAAARWQFPGYTLELE
jgi:hypothetical protein